jgi:outer membrane lipoprotein-sorting protein
MLLSTLCALAFSTAETPIDRSAKSLFAAESLSVTLTLNPVGGDPEEQTVKFAKPNKLRWESATALWVTDGITTIQYNKKTKTYKKGMDVPAFLKVALAQKPLWGWSAFFDAKFTEQISKTEVGASRKFRGEAAKDVVVTRKDDAKFTLTVDDAKGVPVLVRYAGGEGQPDWLVVANDLLLGKKIEDTLFAFTSPDGAKDEAEVSADGPTYTDIKPILDKNCVNCHGGMETKKGINLASYTAVMGGRNMVVAGNPDSSRLIRVIKRGQMPPAGPLPSAEIERLAAWIRAGAKEN